MSVQSTIAAQSAPLPDYRFSSPLEAPTIRAISLGAGVQSSWLVDAASRGDIGPMPDFALFADTGNEPRRVYAHLEELEARARFPIIRVRREGASLAALAIEVAQGIRPFKGSPVPPWYTSGSQKGMLPKQCSKEFKVRPVEHWIRDHLGLAPGQRGPKDEVVELWIGISRDEIHRMGTSERKWIRHRHPLIEMRMTRQDCVRWYMERQMRVPGKSSCIYCPFRDQKAWLRMKQEEPDDWEEACQIDEAIRDGHAELDGQAFVHRQLVPLRQADLNESQMDLDFGDAEECEGHCFT